MTVRKKKKTKKKILFVCVGNSCRSQMAEGFARSYGADVLIAHSAGIAPAGVVARETVTCMAERDIDIRGQSSKGLHEAKADYDLIVNMSGMDLPHLPAPVRVWKVPDPVGHDGVAYRSVRDQIEALVMQLIGEARRAAAQ